MSANRHGWREMRPGRKIVLALFFLFLLAQYLVYAVYLATYAQFDNPPVLSFNRALLDYYTFAEMLFPNLLGWGLFNDTPLPLHLAVVGLLNLASGFGLYVLMIRRGWRAWLVIPGYLLGSIVLSFLVALIVWAP